MKIENQRSIRVFRQLLYCWIDLEPAPNGSIGREVYPSGLRERRMSPVFDHRGQADAWLKIWDQMVPKGGWKLKEIQMPDDVFAGHALGLAVPVLSSKLPERYERAIWDYEYHQDWLEQKAMAWLYAYEAWLADQHSGVAGRED